MRTIPPPSVVAPSAIYDLVSLSLITPPEGCFVEVGVYKGGTAWHLAQIAEERNVPLFLYDTFTGIPFQDEIDKHAPGDFGDSDAGAVRNAVPYATVIEGVFPESKVEMPKIAFAHIDCDQYKSIVDSVKSLAPLMMPHGIMVFDDYGHLEGATKAVHDLFGDKINISRAGKAFVVFG
jgi:O-methyltransferase